MEILAKKLPYITLEERYNSWKKQADLKDAQKRFNFQNNKTNSQDITYRQKQAQVVADNILMLDNYVYNKAEDVEAVFQTVNIQLLAGVSALSTIPKAITKIIPTLKKNQKVPNLLKILEKYDSAGFKAGSKFLPLSSVLTWGGVGIAALLYARGVTQSIKAQLGATRRAKFEGLTQIFNSDSDYAVLTPLQENEINKQLKDKNNPINRERQNTTPFLAKLFERINIRKSLQQTRKLIDKNSDYEKIKREFEDTLNHSSTRAPENKELLDTLIKKVDLKSEYELERIDKVINVGYSSLFVGGYLEYLISEKLVDLLKLKNPVVKQAAKLLIPFTTYMILNKNLANIQNSAIRATRYKNLKNFVADKANFADAEPKNPRIKTEDKIQEKEPLLKFLKGMFKDIKEYRKFEETELPELQKRHELKKSLTLYPDQKAKAKKLKESAQFVINKEANNRQFYAQGIEAFSEIALAPIEILSTALGAYLGAKAGIRFKNPALKNISKALGAIAGFTPTAVVEVLTTKEQKKALRIASMKTTEEMEASPIFKK